MISIVIAVFTCFFLILFILKKPTIYISNRLSIDSFWLISLIGALLVILTKSLPIDELFKSLINNSAINPIKIIVLLISISALSITLDELGFFNYIANKAIKFVNHSQYKLFFILYGLIAFLTIFTSNDIIILTFTLFICYFAKEAKINPIPYLVMEFIVANTYSMIFVIGNPTNIYLATINNISFIEYFKVMAIPTLITGATSAIILFLIFFNQLKKPFNSEKFEEKKLKSLPLTIISLSLLIFVMILLAISSYINIEMWLITFIAAITLLIILIIYSIYKKSSVILKDVMVRLPWNLGIFVIGMFTIVLSLNYNNIFLNIANFFGKIAEDSKFKTILIYGITSTISDNLVNNIPMSLAYSLILQDSSIIGNAGIYATIIGSNIGAFLTPVGALAGIMWMNILKKQHVKFTFLDFTKYGIILTTVLLSTALLSLFLII